MREWVPVYAEALGAKKPLRLPKLGGPSGGRPHGRPLRHRAARRRPTPRPSASWAGSPATRAGARASGRRWARRRGAGRALGCSRWRWDRRRAAPGCQHAGASTVVWSVMSSGLGGCGPRRCPRSCGGSIRSRASSATLSTSSASWRISSISRARSLPHRAVVVLELLHPLLGLAHRDLGLALGALQPPLGLGARARGDLLRGLVRALEDRGRLLADLVEGALDRGVARLGLLEALDQLRDLLAPRVDRGTVIAAHHDRELGGAHLVGVAAPARPADRPVGAGSRSDLCLAALLARPGG